MNTLCARVLGREFVGFYLGLASYVNNLRRHGFTETDLVDGGLDRLVDALVDALVAWGTPEQVAGKLRAHLTAGADHVAIQFLNGHHAELAAALKLGA
jgi:alkanesulfonate monooxygenase SsuD/methylene tetrahydromethanopterin reductase-like flavin-dependent oxidoreductase (luciferase family)